MQRKDLKVGVVYAFRDRKYSQVRPVRIVEINPAWVQDPEYHYKRRQHSGIMAMNLNPKTLDESLESPYVFGIKEIPGRVEEVESRQIVHTWEHQEHIKKVAAEQDERVRARREAEKREVAHMWTLIDALVPEGALQHLHERDRGRGAILHFRADQLLNLVQAVARQATDSAEKAYDVDDKAMETILVYARRGANDDLARDLLAEAIKIARQPRKDA